MTRRFDHTQDTLWRRTLRGRFACDGALPKQMDVVVVGGGFTGLTAALHIARAGKSVAVLDAGRLGEGASGANAGFVVPNFALMDPDAVRAKLGHEAGNRLLDLVSQGADRVFQTAREESIDCDAAQTGWLNPAISDSVADTLKARAEFWQSRGRPVRFIDADATQRQTGMSIYRGALLDESGGTIHPLDYLLGLANAVQRQGGTIVEETPVSRLNPLADGWRIEFEGGSLTADRVLLCTNAFTGGAARRLGCTTVPLKVYQLATAPLDAATVARISPDRRPVGDTRQNLFTYRLDRDNRLISGGMAAMPIGAKARLANSIAQRLATELSLSKVPEIEVVWTGTAAMTPDFLPRIHQIGKGGFAGIGCNGRGIAMTAQLGRTLAEAALGTAPEDLPIPVRPIRPLPFHRFAPLAVSAGLLKARALDAISGIKTRTKD